jgi:hypothetical protein
MHADCKLFEKIQCKHHCLHHRERRHNFALPVCRYELRGKFFGLAVCTLFIVFIL